MQSKHQTAKVNETVNNLVNGEKIMLATEENTLKFNQEELIAIQEFNKDFKELIEEYQEIFIDSYIQESIKYEVSIETENLIEIYVEDVFSEIYLRENENQREFCTKIYIGFYPSGLIFGKVFYGEIKEALINVLGYYEFYLSSWYDDWEKNPKLFDRTEKEYINKYVQNFASYINQYQTISVDSLMESLNVAKLGFKYDRICNAIAIRILNPYICLTLTIDETMLSECKIYVLKRDFQYKHESDIFFDDFSHDDEIICYTKIEEALEKMFSWLKTHLNKELESETYSFLKKV